MQQHYTDYEATVIYLTAVRYALAPPSTQLRRELAGNPQLDRVLERHSFGSVSARWSDFRTAVRPELTATRGARLAQVRQIIEDWEWLTGLPYREDLAEEKENLAVTA